MCGIPVTAYELNAVVQRSSLLVIYNFSQTDQRISGLDVKKRSVSAVSENQGYFVGCLIWFNTILPQDLIEAAVQIFIFKIGIGHWEMIGFNCDWNSVCTPDTNGFNNMLSR